MANDTFKRIQVRAQAMVQNTSTSTSNANDLLPKVKDWCRSRYNRILRAFLWPELLRKENLALVAGTTDYALSRDVEQIVTIWDTTNGKEIKERDIQEHVRFQAPLDEVAGNVQTGQTNQYIILGYKSVNALMSTADTVEVLSTSANDVSPKVIQIVGEVSGVEVREELTLIGATVVAGTNTYDSGAELRVSAGTSDGTLNDLSGVVTIRETTADTTLSQLGPGERSINYLWIKVHPEPAAAATLQAWYKRKWRPLVNDNDIPIVECADEIVTGVVADALWEDGQEQAALAQEQKYSQLVNELWQKRQPSLNTINQFVPDNVDTEMQQGRLFFA